MKRRRPLVHEIHLSLVSVFRVHWLFIRAHRASAYCELFCFFQLFFPDIFLRLVGRLPQNFAQWSEHALLLIRRHQISKTFTPYNFDGQKFGVFSTPISHCVPIVFSADQFSSNKQLSVDLRCLAPVGTAFVANFLQCEVWLVEV